jgi:hypothetical protein
MHNYEKCLHDLEEFITLPTKFNSFIFADRETCIQNLMQHFQKCHTLSIVDLKKKNNDIQIIKQKTINEIHPLYSEYSTNQLSCFSNHENIRAYDAYLDVLNIDSSQVEEIVPSRQKSVLKLYITHYSEWSNFELNHLRYYNFTLQIDTICSLLTNSVKNKNLSISRKEELITWYQTLKFEINQIIYDLFKTYDLEVKDCKPAVKEKYLRLDYIILVIDKLEKLQQKIEKRYQNCIERVFDISSKFIHENLDLIQQKIVFIEKYLKDTPFSHDLKQILFAAFAEFKSKSLNETVSFSRFSYMQTFTSHFENRINSMKHKNEMTDQKIMEFLIEMNFNSIKFLEWISSNLFKKTDKIGESKARYRFLLQQLTFYSNLPIRVRAMYNETAHDLRSYFLTILQYELQFSTAVISTKEKSENTDLASTARIKLSTNISVFMMLFRYLNQNGVFENTTPASLAEFVSEHFYTSHAKNLTKGSLRNKYYNNDPEQKRELQILLQSIIAALKKD